MTVASCGGNRGSKLPTPTDTDPTVTPLEPSFHVMSECPRGLQGKWLKVDQKLRSNYFVSFANKGTALEFSGSDNPNAFVIDGSVRTLKTGGSSTEGATIRYVGSCRAGELVLLIRNSLGSKHMDSEIRAQIQGDTLTRKSTYSGASFSRVRKPTDAEVTLKPELFKRSSY